jgi:DNA-binding PadR family transcriptional regulator
MCKTLAVVDKRARLPTLSSKEQIILELLVGSDALYGLQLVEESGGRLKRGTVYVTLGRMEQKGLVESQHGPSTREPDAVPRRMYRATAHGRRVLEAWRSVARALALEPGR